MTLNVHMQLKRVKPLLFIVLFLSLISGIDLYGAVQPMPLISRDARAYMSENRVTQAGNAHNAEYNDICSFDNSAWPKWLAYDLSHVPEAQRQLVVVRWRNPSWSYFDVPNTIDSVYRAPRDYEIQANSANGGGNSAPEQGWVTLSNGNVVDNVYHSRTHIVDLNGANWIRILMYTGTDEQYDSIKIEMDIHDASLGAEDTWLFTGDSITAAGMRTESVISGSRDVGPNFAEQVSCLKVTGDFCLEDEDPETPKSYPEHLPAMEGAGRGGWTARDGAERIPGWMNHFEGRYVVISFGGNDALTGLPPDDFYTYYTTIIDAVLEAGKIPVVPKTVAWLRRPQNRNIPPLNDKLAELREDPYYAGRIVWGPDLYDFFIDKQDRPPRISDDDIHPSGYGYKLFRREWARRMMEILYKTETPPAAPKGLGIQ